MVEIVLKTLEDTEKLAKILVENLNSKLILTLNGDLAAGKTTFTKYLAKYLGVTTNVNSPTFNIMKEYETTDVPLYHIDAYRLEGTDEDLGFEDIFYQDAYVVIEWAQFIEDFLPSERLIFDISIEGDRRVVKISAIGEYYKNIVRKVEEKW